MAEKQCGNTACSESSCENCAHKAQAITYEKLNEILENSRDIITSKQNRKAKNRKFFATGIPIIFMILVVAIYTLLNKQGDD